MTAKTGYVIFAHGSRVKSANDGVRLVTADFGAMLDGAMVETAFLELAEPTMSIAVQTLVMQGATQICVLPYFLTLGTHLRRDLPKLAEAAAAQWPSVEIKVAPPLDGHKGLTNILLERAKEIVG